MHVPEHDDPGLLGTLLVLIGAILALVPLLEGLVAGLGGPSMVLSLLLAAVAAVALMGGVLGMRGFPVVGGLMAIVAGVVLVILGPTGPAVLQVLGGAALFASGNQARDEPRRLGDARRGSERDHRARGA